MKPLSPGTWRRMIWEQFPWRVCGITLPSTRQSAWDGVEPLLMASSKGPSANLPAVQRFFALSAAAPLVQRRANENVPSCNAPNELPPSGQNPNLALQPVTPSPRYSWPRAIRRPQDRQGIERRLPPLLALSPHLVGNGANASASFAVTPG